MEDKKPYFEMNEQEQDEYHEAMAKYATKDILVPIVVSALTAFLFNWLASGR